MAKRIAALLKLQNEPPVGSGSPMFYRYKDRYYAVNIDRFALMGGTAPL